MLLFSVTSTMPGTAELTSMVYCSFSGTALKNSRRNVDVRVEVGGQNPKKTNRENSMPG
jgi:hypothetical protein